MAAGAIAIGGVLNAIIAGGMIFSKLPEPRADILRVFGELSFPVIAVAGMIALAVAVATLSVQARRAAVFSTALTVFSLIVAVVAHVSFVFFPIVLVMIWSLVASVALLRAKPAVAKTASS